ncbi:MAG: serine/threonine protein phosphatase PrpC [Cryomorphaceae bacterium]|jgi:serine/threonine protein phosphatase PrpC
MKYSVAQQSHQGGRDYNEDRTAVYERDGAIMLVVADGLGGHAGGDVASQAFIEALGDSFKKSTDAQLSKAESFLTLSINYAHHTIHRRAVSQGFNVDSPKTTCVVCLIQDGIAHWAHSGDSRLYLIRKRKILEVTTDHVSKKLGRELNSPINRCVGGLESPRPDISPPWEMNDGDIFFLASDGAWHSFKPDDLTDYVDPQHPTLGLDNLLQTLENRNKAPSDNLSIVVLFWGVKQLDIPSINEYHEPNTIQLLDGSYSEKDQTDAPEKFNMAELDDAIHEIESFISDLDEKL